MKKIPNEFPKVEIPHRIAILGHAPSSVDVDFGRPFVDSGGNILSAVLRKNELFRNSVYIGNVNCYSTSKPANIESFEAEQGAEQLRSDLLTFKPNICILLGGTTLKHTFVPKNLETVRGSLFICNDSRSPFDGFKCLASYHPTDIIRQWDWWPYLHFDIQKAKSHSLSPELVLPSRLFELDLSADELITRLDSITSGEVAIDIEGGGPEGISCISFSTDPSVAFVFTPNEFSPETQLRVLRSIRRLLSDHSVGKILQNGLYDQFCLSWHWGCPIINISWDTMLSGWEIYPELKKSLGVQASIYTDEPDYKWHKKTKNQRIFLEYNCRDSAVTHEIKQKHFSLMSAGQIAHNAFNLELLPIAAYMTRRGTLYDTAKAKLLLEDVTAKMSAKMTTIETLIGGPINVNSPKQIKELLYGRFGFERQYKMVAGRKTTSVVADRKALLTLARKFDHPLIPLILEWKHLEGKRKQLSYRPDHLSRVRGMYNIVGTVTGRFSCSISEKDKADKMHYPGGVPMHVINKAHRCLYVADPGYEYFQCDLAGADGWTVAAHCAALGDPKMLDDYFTGNKPAKIIAAMYLYQNKVISTNPSKLSPSELVEFCKTLDIPEWLYFACKRVQHGSNYLLGIPTMCVQILEDSYKIMGTPIYVTRKDAEVLQILYFTRYPGVRSWQSEIQSDVDKYSQLPSASGHTRIFFGRAKSHDLYREAVAHEPQHNTTYATNLAAFNLWNDPDNRTPDNNLIIQPLHQVHDALNGQYPIELRSWAHDRIRNYFNNPIKVAGIRIIIPFEGNYGPNWGEAKNPFGTASEAE